MTAVSSSVSVAIAVSLVYMMTVPIFSKKIKGVGLLLNYYMLVLSDI
jgi:hypothetical protein